MKYLLLFGACYYPDGSGDFRGLFDTINDAVAAIDESQIDVSGSWAEVVEIPSLKVVAAFTLDRDRAGNVVRKAFDRR